MVAETLAGHREDGIPVLDLSTDLPAADKPVILLWGRFRHPQEYAMDQSPIINVLVLADLLPEAEQLVTTIRRGGFSLHAEAVRDERWLQEKLNSDSWDLLLIHATNTRISPRRLGAMLSEIQPDLLCLIVGSAVATEFLQDLLLCESLQEPLQAQLTQILAIPGTSDLDDPRHVSLLLQTLARELQSLQTRRQLSRSNLALAELRGQHQLLLANISEAVAYLHDGMHVYVNPAYASLFGHADPATLLNTAFLDLMDESAMEEARLVLRREQQDQRRYRLRALDANGLPLELWLHCGHVVYHNERALQVILCPTYGSNFQQQAHTPQPPGSQETLTDEAEGLLSRILPTDDSKLLGQRLQLALDNNDIQLLFQPLAGFMEDGLERYAVSIGLCDEGPRSSAHLLKAASRSGLEEKIDRLMLGHCLRLLREENRPGLRLITSLSRQSMMNFGFLSWLRQQLQESQVQSECLVLQLSELDIVDAPPKQVETFCQQLRTLQIALAINHFGGSLDPFSYLPQQHVTYVELDQSLLDGIDSDTSKLVRLQDIVSRLHDSDLLTVSRVERMALLPALWEARINFVHGDCLQEADSRMNFAFIRNEEITLVALH